MARLRELRVSGHLCTEGLGWRPQFTLRIAVPSAYRLEPAERSCGSGGCSILPESSLMAWLVNLGESPSAIESSKILRDVQ